MLTCIFIFPMILCSDCCTTSLLEKLYIHAQVVPSYTLTNAMIRYKSCIWIGAFLSSCHSSALGGQSGIPATYSWLKHIFRLA